jgi:hypothetical protein
MPVCRSFAHHKLEYPNAVLQTRQATHYLSQEAKSLIFSTRTEIGGKQEKQMGVLEVSVFSSFRCLSLTPYSN